MSNQFDLIIVTADEPYEGLSHTQILFANYLSRSTDLIFIEAPGPWHPFKLFRRRKIRELNKEQPQVLPYFNLLPVMFPFGTKVNEYLLDKTIRQLIRRFQKKNILIWHFDSYRSELKNASFTKSSQITHLYHVIDPFYNNPIDKALRRISQLIVLTSPHIAEHYQDQSEKMRLLPQCVDLEECRRLLALPVLRPVPEQGYFMLLGTLSDDLDFQLLQKIADLAPILIGGKVVSMPKKEKQYKELLQHNNIHYLGLLKPEIFYPLLKRAIAGIISYDISIRNRPFSPLKAVNYLLAGIPVISNCRTELENLQDCAVYERPQALDFLAACDQSLKGELLIDKSKLAAYAESISMEKAIAQIFTELRKD
jgi:hypothetical protein